MAYFALYFTEISYQISAFYQQLKILTFVGTLLEGVIM